MTSYITYTFYMENLCDESKWLLCVTHCSFVLFTLLLGYKILSFIWGFVSSQYEIIMVLGANKSKLKGNVHIFQRCLIVPCSTDPKGAEVCEK